MGWIVSILGGLWGIISQPANLLWGLLIRFWPVFLALGVGIVALWPYLKAGFVFLRDQTGFLIGQINGSGANLTAKTAAGWPAWMGDGFAFINVTLPLAELMLMFSSLVLLKIGMAVWRVLKSILPVIGT